ncbi:MAG: hypothetical protein QNJ77_06730 [Acidimicrobiia bacterium]|nr:hypothetical protein [Acidimicrobiia bacterium]
MFDGVGWAAGEIVVFMLIATLIGFALGWVFGRWLQKESLAADFESQLADESDRAEKAKLAQLESEQDLEKARLELKAEQGRFAELEGELETSSAAAVELEASVAELAEKEAEVERLSSQLAEKEEVEKTLAAVSAESEAKSAEHERLSAELAEKSTRVDALTVELAGKVELEQRLAAADAQDAEIQRLEAELAVLGSERDELSADLARARSEVAATVAAVPSGTEVEPTVEATVPSEPIVEPAVTAIETEPESAVEPTKEEGLAHIAEIAARTAAGGPAADDDLKKVRGIGPKLERTLKGLGITSFRQIANFESDDIAYVTAALDAFKGRIERDDWMSSAAAEHQKKYHEPA